MHMTEHVQENKQDLDQQEKESWSVDKVPEGLPKAQCKVYMGERPCQQSWEWAVWQAGCGSI